MKFESKFIVSYDFTDISDNKIFYSLLNVAYKVYFVNSNAYTADKKSRSLQFYDCALKNFRQVVVYADDKNFQHINIFSNICKILIIIHFWNSLSKFILFPQLIPMLINILCNYYYRNNFAFKITKKERCYISKRIQL